MPTSHYLTAKIYTDYTPRLVPGKGLRFRMSSVEWKISERDAVRSRELNARAKRSSPSRRLRKGWIVCFSSPS